MFRTAREDTAGLICKMYNVKGEIIMTREANPIPQGKYVPATRFGNMIFTAGMTPRNNGCSDQNRKSKSVR